MERHSSFCTIVCESTAEFYYGSTAHKSQLILNFVTRIYLCCVLLFCSWLGVVDNDDILDCWIYIYQGYLASHCSEPVYDMSVQLSQTPAGATALYIIMPIYLRIQINVPNLPTFVFSILFLSTTFTALSHQSTCEMI